MPKNEDAEQIADQDGELVTELRYRLSAFEKENPKLMEEVDSLSKAIESFEMVVADSEPQIITTTNTTLVHATK